MLCVQDKAMKQAWCLATSSTDESSKALMKLYGKRSAVLNAIELRLQRRGESKMPQLA